MASYTYPLSDRQRMKTLMQTSMATLSWDDAFTRTALVNDPRGTLDRTSRFRRALAGERPSAEDTDELMLWHTYQDIAARSSPAFMARFRQRSHVINDSIDVESQLRHDRDFLPWTEFIEFRRINLYGFWVTQMAEFSVGVDMTETLEESLEIRALELTAIDHLLFVNDLYSFPKEAAIGEASNAFWVLRRQGLDVQTSVDRLATLVRSTKDAFLTLRAKIAAGPLGERPETHLYIDALAHAMAGNQHYSSLTTRYWGTYHSGTPVTSGTVTIGKDGTVSFVPDP